MRLGPSVSSWWVPYHLQPAWRAGPEPHCTWRLRLTTARCCVPRSLSQDTAPALFTNQNVRVLLGADKTCMTCPRCGSAAQPGVDDGRMLLRPCKEYVNEVDH